MKRMDEIKAKLKEIDAQWEKAPDKSSEQMCRNWHMALEWVCQPSQRLEEILEILRRAEMSHLSPESEDAVIDELRKLLAKLEGK